MLFSPHEPRNVPERFVALDPENLHQSPLHQNRAQQQLWSHELTRGENLENLGAVWTLPNQKCFTMKGKQMRIALVAPLAEAVPPKLYGGTERVVSWLAEELVRQGHKVTLFASGGSQTAANLVVCAPQSLRLAGIRDHLGSTLRMLREVRQRADDFDIIHFHVDLLPKPCSTISRTNV